MFSIKEEELIKILPKDGPSMKEVKKYLDKYNDEFIVIKCGGSVLIDPNLFNIFIQDIAVLNKLGFNPVIVHGGGKRINSKLSEFNIKKEILQDQNCGTGVVEFAIFIATGLNIFGALYGVGGSIVTAVVFWFVGQTVLILASKYYNFITQYNIHEQIENDNVAVGIGFAGALIAIGNLLRAASAENFIWGVDMN